MRQALAEKIFIFRFSEIYVLSLPSRSLQEGRFAIVTDVGSGMRWTQQHARRSELDADGETVWSWPPDAEVKFASDLADDGGYQSPDTGESTA
jgi:hypothetical protein